MDPNSGKIYRDIDEETARKHSVAILIVGLVALAWRGARR